MFRNWKSPSSLRSISIRHERRRENGAKGDILYNKPCGLAADKGVEQVGRAVDGDPDAAEAVVPLRNVHNRFLRAYFEFVSKGEVIPYFFFD